MSQELIQYVQAKYRKASPPEFRIGDTINVYVRITEGEKERIQPFSGVVIARKGGGLTETFTVRRIVANEGVERIFPVHCPSIQRVEVSSSGKVRRAKLYYLRDRLGKARKLREKRTGRSAQAAAKRVPAKAKDDASAETQEPQLATAE